MLIVTAPPSQAVLKMACLCSLWNRQLSDPDWSHEFPQEPLLDVQGHVDINLLTILPAAATSSPRLSSAYCTQPIPGRSIHHPGDPPGQQSLFLSLVLKFFLLYTEETDYVSQHSPQLCGALAFSSIRLRCLDNRGPIIPGKKGQPLPTTVREVPVLLPREILTNWLFLLPQGRLGPRVLNQVLTIYWGFSSGRCSPSPQYLEPFLCQCLCLVM
jgi:hypothetical protein